MFVTFSCGIAALSIAAVAYHKTKEQLVRSYLTFHLAFSLAVFVRMLLVYSPTSRFPFPTYIMIVLTYIEGFIAPFLLMLTLPIFVHCLFAIPNARRRNGVFFGIAMIFYSLGHFFEFALKDESLTHIRQVINDAALFLILLYSIVVGLKYVGSIHETTRKTLARKMVMMLGIAVPVMLYDTFVQMFPPLHPLLYMAMALFVSHYMITHSLQPVQTDSLAPSEKTLEETSETPLTLVPDDEVFQHYNISPREQELIPLVLQGYTNQQIGETLYISLSTVKTHLRSIYSKFDVKNRYELIAFLQNMKHQ